MDVKNEPQVLASLIFLTGPLAGQTYAITKSIITLGRNPNNDVVITEPSVSRYHARISFTNGIWMISKQQVQNTLTINQRDVSKGPLQHGDTIGLGSGVTTFTFHSMAAVQHQRPTADAGTLADDEQDMHSPMVLKAPQQSQQSFAVSELPESLVGPQGTVMALPPSTAIIQRGIPTLEISNNTNHERHSYELKKPIITIGRAPDNDIVINVPTVSGYHAQIMRQGNQLIFVHPNPERGQTRNGIIYNGRLIAGNEQFSNVLTRGDVFRISDEHGTYVTLTYNDGKMHATERV